MTEQVGGFVPTVMAPECTYGVHGPGIGKKYLPHVSVLARVYQDLC